ncbi:MAG: hypothetical protein Kow00124_29020 [Anaerolineae bacterium]
MGIQLDWEFETERGIEKIGEDPAELARRARVRRRARILLIALAALLLISTAAGLLRRRALIEERRAELEAAVHAEVLALNIGDRESYLALHDSGGAWDISPGDRFTAYRALMPGLRLTGEVLALDVHPRDGRVTLREELDGQPYRVTWYYRYGPGGWRHVPPAPQVWGRERALETAHFTLFYHAEDEALARHLADRIDGWWETARRATGFEMPQGRAAVVISPSPAPGQPPRDGFLFTVSVPSALLDRQPEGEAVAPQTAATALDRLAGGWAAYMLHGDPTYRAATYWLDRQMQLHLLHQIDPSQPPSAFLNTLAELHGPDFILAMVSRLSRSEDDLAALRALLDERAPADEAALPAYLTGVLRAESALWVAGFRSGRVAIFQDPSTEPPLVRPGSMVGLAIPNTVEVIGVQRRGDILWAEVRYRFNPAVFHNDLAPYPARVPGRETLPHIEVFRLVNGRPVHSTIRPGDPGQSIVEAASGVALHYRALDAPFAAGLAAEIAAAYQHIAADFGLTDPAARPAVDAFVVTQLDDLGDGDTFALIDSPPYMWCCTTPDAPREALRQRLLTQLIHQVIAYQTDGVLPHTPLRQAFVHWGQARLGIDSETYFFEPVPRGEPRGGGSAAALPGPTGGGPVHGPLPPQRPQTLADLWAFEEGAAAYSRPEQQAANLLIDLLAEQYGPEIIPALLAALPGARSAGEWLAAVPGVDAAALEAEWQARLEAGAGR